ncbi:MAG TPA: response regulator [Chthoniobacterales bacterium]
MSASHPVIAIVDDEELVRKALERLLRSAEMEARVFASGGEFLTAIAEFNPDCVVLDLHMPGVSGFDVMAGLQWSFPIVVITGHDSPETEARALGGGAAAYLRKPVSDRALIAAISEAIEHSTMRTSRHP